jgi:hypothetical protein
MFESIAQANAVNDARRTAYNSGTLRFYTGARPANVAAGVSGTLLGSLALASTAFGASSNRIITAGTVTQDSSADATGTIGYAACFASDGTTLVSLHSCGVSGSGAECIVNSLSVTSGQPISCSSFTITQPDGS